MLSTEGIDNKPCALWVKHLLNSSDFKQFLLQNERLNFKLETKALFYLFKCLIEDQIYATPTVFIDLIESIELLSADCEFNNEIFINLIYSPYAELFNNWSSLNII